uniref:Uncharacterized protein n=1 Tax=Arundo donax TaxID=35708 RepID=A0A0A9BGQ5_ARUDO
MASLAPNHHPAQLNLPPPLAVHTPSPPQQR